MSQVFAQMNGRCRWNWYWKQRKQIIEILTPGMLFCIQNAQKAVRDCSNDSLGELNYRFLQ